MVGSVMPVGGFPDLVEVKPRERLVFHSDFWEVDERVATIMVFVHDAAARDDFGPFWGVNRIPFGLGADVTTILLDQVSRRGEKWVDDHLKSAENISGIAPREAASDASTAKGRRRASRTSHDVEETAAEIVNGASYLQVQSRMMVVALDLATLDRAVSKLRRLYVDRFGTLSVSAQHGRQRRELTELLSPNELKPGGGQGYTSTEYAGAYSLVTNGLADPAGSYVGFMQGDVNNSAVLFDVDDYPTRAVVATGLVRSDGAWGSQRPEGRAGAQRRPDVRGHVVQADTLLAVHGTGPFARDLDKVDAERDRRLVEAEEGTAAFARELRERYERDADLHAERVAAQARASFLANVEPQVRLAAEDHTQGLVEAAERDFSAQKVTLMDARRERAAQMMAEAELDALRQARELATTQGDALAAAVVAHTAALREAVRTAYGADVDRMGVLAQQQAIGAEVELVSNRADERVADLRADFESRLAASQVAVRTAEAEASRARDERVAAVGQLTSEMAAQLAARSALVQDLRAQLALESRQRTVTALRTEHEAQRVPKNLANSQLRHQDTFQRVAGWVMTALEGVLVVMAAVLLVIAFSRGGF